MIQVNRSSGRSVVGDNGAPMSGAPIHSRFASDPEMREIVALFVAELPARIGELHAAWRTGDLDRIRIMAHQLKGAGGGYGFPDLSTLAGELEAAIRAPGAPSPDLDARVRAFAAMLTSIAEGADR